MGAKTCGCSTTTCGCCEGVEILTPMSTVNRPGLDSLNYRIGTHGTFFETMKARLGATSITGPDKSGAVQTHYPLLGLTTRSTNDPAIALLDAWATAGDVLTFYQERIADEGYLRTAAERRSVLELARLVGYTLRPGVAATVYLSYTLDNNQTTPVTIPKGAQSQSIPGPDELPQMFETSNPLDARADWNNLQVRLTQPQVITLDTAITISQMYVAGTSTGLKAGDSLLLLFDESGSPAVVRKVATVDSQFDSQRTLITFQSLNAKALIVFQALIAMIRKIEALAAAGTAQGQQILQKLELLATQVRLGVALGAKDIVQGVTRTQMDAVPEFVQLHKDFNTAADVAPAPINPPPTPTSPATFTASLLIPPIAQARSSLQLTRDLATAFESKADSSPQMLVKFAPKLRKTFYRAWSGAVVNDKQQELVAVYALRVEASLFGSSVQKMASYSGDKLDPPNKWTDWDLDGESTDSFFLDQAYDSVLPNSYVVVQRRSGNGLQRQVKPVGGVQTQQRTAYGMSGKTTQVSFATNWIDSLDGDLGIVRPVLVYGQSEPLTLIEMPISDDVTGDEINLSQLYDGLTSGRWIIVTGERADIEAVAGVNGTELLMVSALRQDFDANLPGDTTRTTLVLATDMAYRYKRNSSFKVYANVVKATHGETKREILGSGDATETFLTFAIKQPPLTFVSSPNPAGINSSLQVFVNDIEWHETDTLASLGAKDRNFVTLTNDSNITSVIFGNGVEGVRPPTGIQNIASVYRSGIGAPGNVKAGQVSMLQTRPLGVKSVINPLEASGGADREKIESARQNTPFAVTSLDRLVGVEDYANFSRTFAGVGKAASRKISDGRRQLVEVTIAGVDDSPIDITSDLYNNLSLALQLYGDPATPVQVDVRELKLLVTSVRIKLSPDYQWDPVAAAIRAAILEEFGFDNRDFGQPALLCELIAAIQNTEGVAYCDVDAFGGVDEKQTGENGERVLTPLIDISAAVQAIAGKSKSNRGISTGVPQSIPVNRAGFEAGVIRPAHLTIFVDEVQDTIVLNQIL